MPEGDTVLRTARRLHSALAGQPLLRAELRWGESDGSPLVGRLTLEVVARGKHLLHRIEGGWTLHSHLRMEGSWRITPTSAPGPSTGRSGGPDVRAVLGGPEWTALGIRLGMLDLVRTTQESGLVGHLGPDVLGADWDEDRAVANVRASTCTIGEALLDQRNLAGIGTLYCSESLFLQRINPWTPVAELSPEAVTAVIRRAHRLLHANLQHAVQSTTGSRRRGENAYVHARSGRPCRRCGTTIRVAMIGDPPSDRTMFSCLTCQPGERPSDPGTPQAPLGSAGGRGRRRKG